MDDRPTYVQQDAPPLAGLSPIAKMQVVAQMNCALLFELVEEQGGEILLPPGFAERMAENRGTIETTFLEDGSYRLRSLPMPGELVFPGEGTRWEKLEGPRRKDQERVVYEVVHENTGGYTALQKLDEDGQPVTIYPILKVQTDSLQRQVGGWRAWRVPDDVLESIGPEGKGG